MPDETTPSATPVEPAAPAATPVVAPDPTPPATTPPAAPATPAAADPTPPLAADPAAAVAAQIAELEGLLDGKPFKVPANLQFTWKDHGREGLVSIDEMRDGYMRTQNYTRKTAALAEQAEALRVREREVDARNVEIEARLKLASDNRQRLIDAYAKGGDALARELEHQQRLETDPDYRQRITESEEFRVRQKIDQHAHTLQLQDTTENITQRIDSYIAKAVQKHPGVDPDVVREQYARALAEGRADFHADDVDKIIAAEAGRIDRLTSPFRGEVDQLKQQVAALTAQLQAEMHNRRTDTAISRATGTQPGKPANGNPPAPTPGLKPFNPDTDDPAEWRRKWRDQVA